MSLKLLSENTDATITDDDQVRIDAVLSFWFREQSLSAPQIDGRMDIWFGEDPLFDEEIVREFLMMWNLPRRAVSIIGDTSQEAAWP